MGGLARADRANDDRDGPGFDRVLQELAVLGNRKLVGVLVEGLVENSGVQISHQVRRTPIGVLVQHVHVGRLKEDARYPVLSVDPGPT